MALPEPFVDGCPKERFCLVKAVDCERNVVGIRGIARRQLRRNTAEVYDAAPDRMRRNRVPRFVASRVLDFHEGKATADASCSASCLEERPRLSLSFGRDRGAAPGRLG